jgi:hypothetical protein
MPHSINESRLDEICAQCRKPHGNSITLENYHHKVYEVITCKSCGYEIIRLRTEVFTPKFEVFKKT